ncbi:hypothetical protein EJF36_09795 [Bacillus sp. HMF5848]|uniref:HesB/YadR/YfhF family protein n=1 Tax=Bacillus sp. HMF5848 TaxID=2495421 RepID=UPI000F79D482|nr:HesB/YadR/YfhF family protein [Bacillus sp. HMF5848]RSK27147.1 hypothetical protein EJF36_09795 [Bacillus sp. HMF5848]
MKISITNEAVQWYKEELSLTTGYVKFFVRYGGSSTIQEGFSLGISTEPPQQPAVETTMDGITFYIEEADVWYFDEKDMNITMDDKSNEPKVNIQ